VGAGIAPTACVWAQRKWGQRRASFFGAYGGIRDGSKFVFGRFQYVGIITAIGTTLVVFLVSLGIVHWNWGPEEYRDVGFALQELITNN
jgi:hypothetical protein